MSAGPGSDRYTCTSASSRVFPIHAWPEQFTATGHHPLSWSGAEGSQCQGACLDFWSGTRETVRAQVPAPAGLQTSTGILARIPAGISLLCTFSDLSGGPFSTSLLQCTMYLTLHSFSLKLCSATIDLKHSAMP